MRRRGRVLTLSINDVSIVEGNRGQRSAVFAVTLSAASTQSVAVNYATSNGTAAAGTDYRSRSGTLTFTAGVTSTTISVPVLGDKLPEPNETFNVTPGNAVNATIQRSVGIGTIVDDDAPQPSVSVNDVTVQESGSAVFTVTLSVASQNTVTVAYATADGTATAGGDYTAVSGSLTFGPGQTSQTVAVSTGDDTLAEPSETFQLVLSNASGATVLDGTGVATIVDDDGTVTPLLSINDVKINEGNSGTRNVTLTVTLSSASTQTVTVNYATVDGSATAPSDYQAQTGVLSFSPGVTSQTIRVAVVGDRLREPTEVFYVDLAGATNASIQKSRGAVTIPAND